MMFLCVPASLSKTLQMVWPFLVKGVEPNGNKNTLVFSLVLNFVRIEPNDNINTFVFWSCTQLCRNLNKPWIFVCNHDTEYDSFAKHSDNTNLSMTIHIFLIPRLVLSQNNRN